MADDKKNVKPAPFTGFGPTDEGRVRPGDKDPKPEPKEKPKKEPK